MARYTYSGRDQQGLLVSNTVDANSADGVANQLMDRGITPIAIKEVVEPLSFEMPELFKKKVSLEELTMFSRQMYSLIKAGVVLNRAIRGLAESVTNVKCYKM